MVGRHAVAMSRATSGSAWRPPYAYPHGGLRHALLRMAAATPCPTWRVAWRLAMPTPLLPCGGPRLGGLHEALPATTISSKFISLSSQSFRSSPSLFLLLSPSLHPRTTRNPVRSNSFSNSYLLNLLRFNIRLLFTNIFVRPNNIGCPPQQLY